MAAAALKTWAPGEKILLGDLNNEIANIYAEINNISGANIVDASVTPAKLSNGANPEVFFGEIFQDKVVTSGLTYVSTTLLTVTLAAGTAYILQTSTSPNKLVRVTKTLPTVISLSASLTQYIDLKSNGQFTVTTSTTVTTDASRILKVVTNASAVTSQSDLAKRVFGDDFALTFSEAKGIFLHTTSTAIVQLEADFVILSEDGTAQITHGSALTADITVAGAGGLDQGTESSAVWYAVLVIADSTGVTDPTLLLVSETNWNADTEIIPTGYDIQRRVGWVKNSSSNFLLFNQSGNTVTYEDEHDISTNFSSTSFTDVGTSSFVAPNCRLAHISGDTGDAGGSTESMSLFYTKESITASSGGVQVAQTRSGSESFDDSRSGFHASNVLVGSGSTRDIAFRKSGGQNIDNIAINGYEDPLSD